MATPSLPQRKGPSVNVSPNGTKMSAGVPNPVRKTVAPFSNPGDGAYKRVTAPVSPTSPAINDKDAGRGTGNVR